MAAWICTIWAPTAGSPFSNRGKVPRCVTRPGFGGGASSPAGSMILTVYQWGRFGDGKATPESLINAWALMLEAGYSWPNMRFKPQIGVKANVISGDHDPRPGSSLQTFQPLFPNPAYFSQAAFFGLSNIRDLHPSLGLCLTKSLSLAVDYDWVWRDSKADRLYAPDGNLRRDGIISRKRFVGRQLQAEASWQPNRHLKAAMIYVRCWPEAFLLDGQPSGVVLIL